MHVSRPTFLFLAAVLSTTLAAPIDGNLSLEGLSNKIRSGAIAVANPARPSDSRVQRIVSQDGVIVSVDSGELPRRGGSGGA